MARLRRNKKQRPPQTIHVSLTLDQHELLTQNKIERDEALYQVLQRILIRYQELEIIHEDLKETVKQARMKIATLESATTTPESIRVRM